ncbi:MarR family winged helix-turn-helix transcriptional regulator [Sphingomonas sp. Root710]|uniref:MarR family winged helix-turn-helix transcriptional regulator n=1 Tax=Sphingomonas sp. Root710 TaxID=1736594 RepID=UPI0009E8E3B5|nr:MarR family transcriptional regulator [Sphingomonas sp. Root710]
MHDIARRSRYWFDARARSAGSTRAQWRVLFNLARVDGPTQSELADLLDVERITLCRMVDRLAEAGLVERRADPADRRVWRIHLTERAAPVIDELTHIADEMENNILEPLSIEERATLTDLLIKVRNNMRDRDELPEQISAGAGQ